MNADIQMSASRGIVLQNSKVAAVDSFGENLKHEKIDDSYSLRGATELTYEFGARE